MKRSSVFYTITFIFMLATTSIFLAFLWLMDYDKQNYTRELNTKYTIFARATLLFMSDMINNSEYKKQIENFPMLEIRSDKIKFSVLEHATILEEIGDDDIGTAAILLYKKRHFLKVVHENTVLLFEDRVFQPYRYDIIKLIFILVFAILVTAYIFIIQKIKPLRKLKKQIDKFARGNLNIKNVSTGKDEISEVAQAFYQAVNQINILNSSRQLFLRNIMHELKTPITKGRITVEMLEDNIYKQRLISVFAKLENLIDDFAVAEKATAGIDFINIGEYQVKALIDEAIKDSMVEHNFIILEGKADFKISVDFKLFSVAIKNMIDNGYKYASDKKVRILVDENSIRFITKGEKLEKDLEFFSEPFTKGKNAKESFGLGLYIVSNILKVHKLKFEYNFLAKSSSNELIFSGLKNITSVEEDEEFSLEES